MPVGKRWGVRLRDGEFELVWIEHLSNGWWRGIRLPDGARTRGPVTALYGRYADEGEAREAMEEML